MPVKTIAAGRIMQTAFVTSDIERSIADFARDYGVAGWGVIDKLDAVSVFYRGKPATVNVRAAVAFQGDMMWEFIQPLDDVPSVYRAGDGRLREGFHHIGIIVDDMDAQVERYRADGCEVMMEITIASGGRGAYLQRPDGQTGMIELLEASPAIDGFLDIVASVEKAGSRAIITHW
ncbi:Glyoxalase/Bleomycin resistance protein/Dioxygenase superfamily protein [Sphingobium faniae]|nr:Glyoxalase/Bleomycin resistance protein/Dioxygenase superfamily protein [Sphingobium faniae]